jgi:putative MATE family efflux protein
MDLVNNENLTPKQMRRVIYALAFPIVGTNLLLRGVGIVDTAMVGHISAQAQAAVGMSQWIIGLMMALLWGVALGGTVSVANFTGARDEKNRISSADTVFWMGLGASAIVTVLALLFVRPLSYLMGADDTLSRSVGSYMFIICLFFASKGTLMVVGGIFQGFGDTKTPFRVNVGVNFIHILIAYPLTFGVWGYPRLEIIGVALATVTSETLGAAFLVYLAYRKKLLRFRYFSFVRMRNIISLGLPVFGERIMTFTSQIVYTRFVLLVSLSAYAAHAVGLMIEAVAFLPGIGFAQAATTLVGQNLGARLPHMAKKFSNQALIIGLTIMGFLGVTYWVFPEIWMKIFSNDPEVIEYGKLFCKFAAVLQIPLAATMILAGSLRGAGQTRWVMYVTIVGTWFVRVPVAYIFGSYLGYGIFFIWLAMPVDWTVRAILMLVKFYRHKWSSDYIK